MVCAEVISESSFFSSSAERARRPLSAATPSRCEFGGRNDEADESSLRAVARQDSESRREVVQKVVEVSEVTETAERIRPEVEILARASPYIGQCRGFPDRQARPLDAGQRCRGDIADP